MRAVVQRVHWAEVHIEHVCISRIEKGLLVFLGVGQQDTPKHAEWIARKIAGLRIFPDAKGHFNFSLSQIQGSVMVVSQFTLYGDVYHGYRPSFTEAAAPAHALQLYELVITQLQQQHKLHVETGRFGAMMDIVSANWGPVTILLSKDKESTPPPHEGART